MPEYFARNRVAILGSFMVFGLAAILVNLVDLRTNGPAAAGALGRVYAILPNLVAETAGIVVRGTWFQWVVALFVLGRLAYLMIVRIVVG